MTYAFGDYELDEALFELRACGERIELRRQALDVFLYLVRHRDRVVTKDELQDAVWSGASVSETAIPQAIVAIRRALDEGAQDQRTIQTVRGRGYRFVAKLVDTETPSQTSELPFIGRAPLVESFLKMLGAAKDGVGGVVLVAGDVGAGKTRALLELSSAAKKEGAVVLAGRAYDDEGVPHLWPWTQVLRAAREAWPERTAFAALERPSDSDQFQTFDRISRALLEQTRPVLIAIDDLHLADSPSILLFKMIAQSARGSRVLVAGTYRDTSLATNPVLGRAIGALAREHPRRCFGLDPLAATDVRTLASGVLETAPNEDTIARMHSKTGGSPLLLAQMLYVMRIEAALATLPAGATSAMLSAQTMREAIGLNLRNLSDACRRTLSFASVLGRAFTGGALATLMERSDAEVLGALDEARNARILDRKASEFAFVHGLVRDVLYKELPLADRLRLHERAAGIFEALGDTDAAAKHGESARALVG